MRHHDHGYVVMPALPIATFIMVQAEFLFELMIVLLDLPTTFDQADDAPQCIVTGKVTETILGRCLFRLRPLDQ